MMSTNIHHIEKIRMEKIDENFSEAGHYFSRRFTISTKDILGHEAELQFILYSDKMTSLDFKNVESVIKVSDEVPS